MDKYYTSKPTAPSMILSDFIWFNSIVKIDTKPVHFLFLLQKLELYWSMVQ